MRFPHADIYELLSLDLLHQAIKGTFKDHLVQWVEDYLRQMHGPSKAEAILVSGRGHLLTLTVAALRYSPTPQTPEDQTTGTRRYRGPSTSKGRAKP